MTERESDQEERDDGEEERIWRERRAAVQKRVTPEDFAIFIQNLEQIEARIFGKALGETEEEEDKYIFYSMRNVYYLGYTSGLDATERA